MTAVETPSSLFSPTTVTPPKSLRRLRDRIKQMLRAWEAEYPGRTESLFRSLQNVLPSHLADPHLFDFGNLRAVGAEKVEDTLQHPADLLKS